jgi:hypothetical protein
MSKHFSDSEYILNFGDSWAHAADAGHQDGYSYLMSCSLRLTWKDYSVPSSSVGNMILQLQNFLKTDYNQNHNYTALFFVTAQERQLMFDANGNPVDYHPQQHGEYYQKYYNHRLGNYSLNTAMITLQSICRRYKIKDHYLLGWQLPMLWHEVDVTKFYDYGRSSAINMFAGPDANLIDLMTDNHPCLISSTNGHPSKEGHRKIYEEWLKWIQQPHQVLD